MGLLPTNTNTTIQEARGRLPVLGGCGHRLRGSGLCDNVLFHPEATVLPKYPIRLTAISDPSWNARRRHDALDRGTEYESQYGVHVDGYWP